MRDLERGFIDKSKILEYVTEKEIFKLVFKFEPEEFQYTTSPFRDDRNAGCWFEYSPNGKLRFVDFANSKVIYGINMNNIDCFDAVQVYYKLGNFYKTLDFIKEKLIDGKNITHNIIDIKPKKRKRVVIYVKSRPFNNRDKRYWQKYGISKQNLIDDKVFPVCTYTLLNTKYGDFVDKRVKDLTYSFNNFEEGRKKLYRPLKRGKKRFITNCKADDIGEFDSLVESGDKLVISKSYKDCRVLRNQGYNSIWFQNEGMMPSHKILASLCKRFKSITVFFDNDEAGINASHKVKNATNTFYPEKANSLHLPIEYNQKYNISDPADMYRKMGSGNLERFLKDNL